MRPQQHTLLQVSEDELRRAGTALRDLHLRFAGAAVAYEGAADAVANAYRSGDVAAVDAAHDVVSDALALLEDTVDIDRSPSRAIREAAAVARRALRRLER